METSLKQPTVTQTDISGTIYPVNNSLYCLVPEKLRLNQLFFVRSHFPFVLTTIKETDEYVEITYRFKKKKVP